MQNAWRTLARRWVARVMTAVVAGSACAASARAAEPVVPGYYRLRDEAKNVSPAGLGQLLVGELNCTSCHAAPDGAARVRPKGAPDLSAVASRATPQWIRAYLGEPHKVKPGATMPDLFHASEPEAKAGAVDFLTHFLAAQGAPMPASKLEGTTVLVDRGRALYHSVGCVACHAPESKAGAGEAAAEVVPSVPHGGLAGKYTVESLAAFLVDPLKSRPAGRMPSLHLSPADEAPALAAYLLRDQLDNPQVANAAPLRSAGLKFELWENTEFRSVRPQAFERAGRPTASGTVDRVTVDVPGRRSKDGFGLRFSGLIAVPRDGAYTFTLHSDDGARLWIDDKEIIDNDGAHAPSDKAATIDLKAGDHAITLAYFEGQGGEELALSWQGPEIAHQPVPAGALFKVGGRPMIPLDTAEPFVIDAQKAAMGGRMFAAMGCVNCHAMDGLKPTRPAPALAELKDPAGGCLAEQPAKGLPDYALSEEQRAFIGEALTDAASLAAPLEGEALVTHDLAAMNCYACHQRGDVGGAPKDRGAWFTMVKPFDMGDEGRLPPRLAGVGDKLKPAAMEQIVFEGKLHVRRHHMATRMPRFSKDRLPEFVGAVQALDADPKARPEPPFTESAARDGRTLVGIKGLGCVNCHGVAGVPSLGMPALDLSLTVERLKPGWFHALLLDPNSKSRGTRMPAFWFDGAVAYPDLAGGTADSQIDAIWTYLSLGKTMGLPAGMQPGDGSFELLPAGEPLVHRTFMRGVGPRAILVGSPDGIHVAFDADVVRLAKAWRGKFFDAAGSRRDRGGAFYDPAGEDVIDLPAGPSFAALPAPDAPWPVPKTHERNAGGAFKGYRTDPAGLPTFAYQLGDVTIEETPAPVLRQGGATLVRKFTLTGPAPAGLTFLAAFGTKIEPVGGIPGAWKVDDKVTVRLDPKLNARVRDRGVAKQLVVPVEQTPSFAIEMAW